MFRRFLMSVLMDPEPNPGGGGDPGAGADPKPGAFDPAAFKADILGEFNKTLNGFAKTMKNDFSKLFTPPKPADPVDPPPDPKPGDPKPDPEKNALLLEIKKLRESSDARIKALELSNTETQQKAEKTDRESKIRTILADTNKFPFVSDSARETAFRLFSSEVTRSEDGSLVANDLPFEKFIETELPAKHSYLFAPKDVGSAGARSGKTTGGATKWTLDDLKPETFAKYTPAQQAEIRRAVAQANGF